MPETRFGEMAGAGILKNGTTFSINPVQTLRFVTVTDRLTVPQDTSPDSAASVAYVNRVLSGSGRVIAGNGLVANNGVVSLDKKQTFSQVTLSKKPEAPTDAVTVAYVDEVVSDRPSKTYVDLAFEDIKEAYARKAYLEEALTDLASRPSVSRMISDSEAFLKAYVTDAISGLATTNDLNSLLEATQAFVSLKYLDSTINELANVLTNVQNQVSRKASITDLEATEASLVSKADFTDYAKRTPTKSYVDGKVGELVPRSDFEEVMEQLASLEYVDSSVAGLATIEYVDASVASLLPATHPAVDESSSIQYVVPIDRETVKINACAFLILNPQTELETLTLSFPTKDLQQNALTISSSRTINGLMFDGLITAGDVCVPDTITLTAGQPLRFIYILKANAWFIV